MNTFHTTSDITVLQFTVSMQVDSATSKGELDI